jgi:hypothetical protein
MNTGAITRAAVPNLTDTYMKPKPKAKKKSGGKKGSKKK